MILIFFGNGIIALASHVEEQHGDNQNIPIKRYRCQHGVFFPFVFLIVPDCIKGSFLVQEKYYDVLKPGFCKVLESAHAKKKKYFSPPDSKLCITCKLARGICIISL